MKILDRIALHTLLKTILNFIISVLKIFAPKSVENIDVPDKKWRPRWRKKND